jgi:REP element-mobilizing transposase RayT
MSRPLRIEFAGAYYHVTSRGNRRKSIFRGDQDRLSFLEILEKVNRRYHWICHAYCLMDNHYHLVIETPEGNLSRGMRQLNGVYTMSFNRRNRTVGHVFQGRYKAILVEKESYLWEVCRYVVLNPVRAAWVKEPEEWRWSSYRGTVGKGRAHSCLTIDGILGQMGQRKKEAQRNYRNFVKEGKEKTGIWELVKGQSILGEDEFVGRFLGYVKGYEKIREIPRGQRYLGRPKLEWLCGQEVTADHNKRNESVFSAVMEWGYSQKEVADYLGLHYSTVSRLMRKKGRAKNKT